ncbi:MAG: DUF4131 domain-containing protein [Bacteroidetes bacterium]|nr:DUF4131 domain-containing protein [Bacteroidota bacterium]
MNYVHRDGIWIGACGKIYLYLNDDSLTENLQAAKLQAGDQIFFSKVPEAIKAPLNPGQYDFKTRSALKIFIVRFAFLRINGKFVVRLITFTCFALQKA